jgi:hypothetical protein
VRGVRSPRSTPQDLLTADQDARSRLAHLEANRNRTTGRLCVIRVVATQKEEPRDESNRG